MINAQCTRINSVQSTDVADPTATVLEAPRYDLIIGTVRSNYR
jgi:hypothetical protein